MSFGAAAILLLVALVAGGSWNRPASAIIVRLASLPALAVVLWRLLAYGPSDQVKLPVAIMLGAFVVGLAQLIPLPPQVWSHLPGRAAFLQVYASVAEPLPWLPVSLAPASTWNGLLALIPPAAMFALVINLEDERRSRLAAVAAIVAIIGVLLGIAQVLQGAGSPLRLYFREDADAVGFFSNRDFYAAMLVTALPLVIVGGGRLCQRDRPRLIFWLIATGAAVLILVAGLAVSKSRAGVLLAFPAAIGGALALMGRRQRDPDLARMQRISALAVLGAAALGAVLAVAMAFTPIAARFHETLAGDLRLQLAPSTVALAEHYGPVGSGLGSFEPVYETVENPNSMISTFAAHAHNDFLEFWLEAGWPALVLMALFLIWYAREALRLLRGPGEPGRDLGIAGALVVALLLLHTTVEFPLRTPALATLFAFACGLMVQPTRIQLAERA